MIYKTEKFMRRALFLAECAFREGEVPVGALIVKDDKIIAEAYNQVEKLKDPTAHSEILAITQACANLDNQRLTNCELYVTMEPCMMCMGAIILSRIEKLFYGAYDHRFGFASSNYDFKNMDLFNKKMLISGGLLEEEASFLLKKFFKEIRKKNENV